MGSSENPTGGSVGQGLCSALPQCLPSIAGTLVGYIWACAMCFSIPWAVSLSRKRVEEEGTQIFGAGIFVLDLNFSEGHISTTKPG